LKEKTLKDVFPMFLLFMIHEEND